MLVSFLPSNMYTFFENLFEEKHLCFSRLGRGVGEGKEDLFV